jgi:hypothetical protein
VETLAQTLDAFDSNGPRMVDKTSDSERPARKRALFRTHLKLVCGKPLARVRIVIKPDTEDRNAEARIDLIHDPLPVGPDHIYGIATLELTIHYRPQICGTAAPFPGWFGSWLKTSFVGLAVVPADILEPANVDSADVIHHRLITRPFRVSRLGRRTTLGLLFPWERSTPISPFT